jgi:hypothetical protein
MFRLVELLRGSLDECKENAAEALCNLAASDAADKAAIITVGAGEAARA